MDELMYKMENFYLEKKFNFKSLDSKKINKIINNGKKINEVFKKNEFNLSKRDSYLRIMKLLNFNHRDEEHSTNSIFSNSSYVEKYLLFMFSIDPDFEMAIIHATEDRVSDIKKKIVEKFGIYDPYLIRIEKAVINKLLSKEKKNDIDEEIEKRAFK